MDTLFYLQNKTLEKLDKIQNTTLSTTYPNILNMAMDVHVAMRLKSKKGCKNSNWTRKGCAKKSANSIKFGLIFWIVVGNLSGAVQPAEICKYILIFFRLKIVGFQ